jgi:hypothetical protein
MLASIARRLISLGALAGTLMVGGCTSDDSPSAPGGGSTHGLLIDACGLVTKAEVAAIFGKPVDTVIADTTSGYITGCSYQGSADPGGFGLPTELHITAFTTAGVQAHQHSTVTTVPSYFAGLKTSISVDRWEQLTGIGNDAIWLKLNGKLQFYKGDVAVDIIYRVKGTLIDTTSTGKAGAKTAATLAAGRL